MKGITFILLIISSVFFYSCYRIKTSNGAGQTRIPDERKINTRDIALPSGYKIEALATGLNFPTGITMDDQGLLYVTESGYAYGEIWTEPRLIQIDPEGRKSVIAIGDTNGPWNGIDYDRGVFYIAEGGQMEGGRILRINYEGEISVITENLPSVGDHHTNGPAVWDGYIYFGQGSATNSGVVGSDNADFGWLYRQPTFHEIPCQDIVLAGENYETDHLLSADDGAKALTGAFSPYNTPTVPGQVIRGRVPCTGAILRVSIEGGEPELVAWGLRNPYGLVFSRNGRLFVTENSFDNRGSRPVWGAGDILWEIKQGTWYGFPDFAGGKPITELDEFKTPGECPPKPLMNQYPNEVPKPVAVLGVHSSSNGMDISRTKEFGFQGNIFIAQFGDMAPVVGKVTSPVGCKVVRVDPNTGVVEDFAVNKGRKNGPASWQGTGGLERPNDVYFDPDGTTMYIVDFGIVPVTSDGPAPKQNTGVIWKVTRTEQ